MADDERNELERIEIGGDLDRHAAEALRLEVERLARKTGVNVGKVRIEQAGQS
jgi:hypothetical protein